MISHTTATICFQRDRGTVRYPFASRGAILLLLVVFFHVVEASWLPRQAVVQGGRFVNRQTGRWEHMQGTNVVLFQSIVDELGSWKKRSWFPAFNDAGLLTKDTMMNDERRTTTDKR